MGAEVERGILADAPIDEARKSRSCSADGVFGRDRRLSTGAIATVAPSPLRSFDCSRFTLVISAPNDSQVMVYGWIRWC